MVVPEDGPLAVEVKAGIVKIDNYFVHHEIKQLAAAKRQKKDKAQISELRHQV